MIILNSNTSCVYIPERDCYQVIEGFEGSIICYYMYRDEIESQFDIELPNE